MSCQVIDVRYRRSSLVKGGLEIPIRVTVDIDIGKNKVQSGVKEIRRISDRAL